MVEPFWIKVWNLPKTLIRKLDARCSHKLLFRRGEEGFDSFNWLGRWAWLQKKG